MITRSHSSSSLTDPMLDSPMALEPPPAPNSSFCRSQSPVDGAHSASSSTAPAAGDEAPASPRRSSSAGSDASTPGAVAAADAAASRSALSRWCQWPPQIEPIGKSAQDNEILALTAAALVDNFDGKTTAVGVGIPAAFNSVSLVMGAAALGLRIHDAVQQPERFHQHRRENICKGLAELGGVIGSGLGLAGKALASTSTSAASAGVVAAATWAEAAGSESWREAGARAVVAGVHTGAAISRCIGEPGTAVALYTTAAIASMTLVPCCLALERQEEAALPRRPVSQSMA